MSICIVTWLVMQGRLHKFSVGWAILDNTVGTYFEGEQAKHAYSRGLGVPHKFLETFHSKSKLVLCTKYHISNWYVG